jgi:hypothetical protein
MAPLLHRSFTPCPSPTPTRAPLPDLHACATSSLHTINGFLKGEMRLLWLLKNQPFCLRWAWAGPATCYAEPAA